MRKIFFTLTFLFFLVAGAFAQTKVGLKAGVNLATVDGKNVEDSEFVLGYVAGVMLNTPIAQGVTLQPELLFSLKGTGDTGTTDNLTLMYLELPLMAKVMLGEAFSLQFGPYAGVLLNSKKGNDNWEDILNNFDGGVGLGLGYNFAQRFSLDLRYMYGLTQVYEDDLPASINVPEAIRDDEGGNRVLQLSLGYLFGGGNR